MDGATILFKRGPEANLPQLQPGEPAFALDTENLFIGSSTGNRQITGSIGGGGSFNGGSIASALGIGATPTSNLFNAGGFYNSGSALIAGGVHAGSINPVMGSYGLTVVGPGYFKDQVSFQNTVTIVNTSLSVNDNSMNIAIASISGSFFLRDFLNAPVFTIKPNGLGEPFVFQFDTVGSLNKPVYATSGFQITAGNLAIGANTALSSLYNTGGFYNEGSALITSSLDVTNSANFASAVRVTKDLIALSALTVANNATFASNINITSDLTVNQSASVLNKLHVASGIHSASKIVGEDGLEISGSITGNGMVVGTPASGFKGTGTLAVAGQSYFDSQVNIESDVNNVNRLYLKNPNAGAAAWADAYIAANNGAGGVNGYAVQMYGYGATGTWGGLTLGGYARFRSDSAVKGLIFTTGGSGGLIFGTSDTIRVRIDTGMQVGTPTGGDKGAGTINVSGNVYRNNSAYSNPDYALEKWATGSIIKYKDNDGAKGYSRLSLDNLEKHIRENWRLPRIPDKPTGIFTMADIALEKIEELTTYVIELKHEIDELKKDKVRKDETL